MRLDYGRGTSTRYDNDASGNHIDRIRKSSGSTGVYQKFGYRFCETCKTSKPRGNRPAIKGWKCDDCLKSK